MSRIAVVGGGVAGLAAALCLSRGGNAVELFERAEELRPVGAGLLLQPSGQAVLRELGLLEAITSRSEPITELRAEQLSGRSLIRIPYAAADPNATGYGVSRGLLFETLLRAASGAGVAIRTGIVCEAHEPTRDGALLRADDGARFGPYDFVVAADGGRSALRAASGLSFHRRDSSVGALWATGPCDTVRGFLLQAVRGTRHLIGILPVGAGRASFFWGDDLRRIDALRAAGFPAFRDRVLRMVPRAAPIFDELDSFERTTFATYTHVRCARWYGDRIVLAGDAAHAMSPHLGQGANLALEDGAAFARALARHGDFRSAAAAYDRERRPATRAYSLLSAFLTPFFQSESRLLSWGRDLALPLFSSLPQIRRLMSRALAGRL